ncbi:hypothetical protein [Microbacterium sp. NPDC055521]
MRADTLVDGVPRRDVAVASESLARADQLPAAGAVGRVGLVIAVIVWAIVFVAMLHHVGRTVWPSRRVASFSRADPSA